MAADDAGAAAAAALHAASVGNTRDGTLNDADAVSDEKEPNDAGAPAKAKTRERRLCGHAGCPNLVINSGLCVRHGARQDPCRHAGCTNRACSGGVCRKHGAPPYLCRVEACGNQALRGGVCQRHGARPKACRVEGCTNQTKRGGGAFRCCYEYSSDVMFGSRFFSSFNSPPN